MTITEAVVAWHHARAEAARLRHERVTIMCDRERAYEAALSSTPVDGLFISQPEPCWKERVQRGPDTDPEHTARSTWCLSCQHRQDIHELYRAATNHRGACERRVLALAAVAAREGA